MLIATYIEALLTNQPYADQVWHLWNVGDIDDETAAISWCCIAATMGHPALCETPTMIYADSEKAWIERRAVKIAEKRGWPLPIARSEAAAEMVRMRTRKPGVVLSFRPKHGTLPSR